MIKPYLRSEPTDLFEVYTTNADQEQLVLVHQGFSRDLAESLMIKKFNQSSGLQDFMLYNRAKQDVVCECLTGRTLHLRNWCQS